MEEIDILELLKVFWRKKFTIIFVVLIFGIIGAGYTYNYTTPLYKAQAKVLLAQSDISSGGNEEVNEITQTDITLNQTLVSTYGELIKSKTIIKQVLENLGIEKSFSEITKNIEVKAVSDTQIIEIAYINENPEIALKITNELLDVFCEKVQEIYNISNVYIVDRAELPQAPYNINHVKDIALFMSVGIILSCMIILVWSLFDTTVKKAEDVEKNMDLSVLGQLPEVKIEQSKKTKKEIITHDTPKSPISEGFRTIRTNLQFMNDKSNAFTMLITSTMPGDGKSWVAANLGVVFAQTNKKVVIIDSDMRKGRLHSIFRTNIFPGLSNYLMDSEKNIKEYSLKTEIENLWIIPAGNTPANPSELLSSERMLKGIEELKSEFDIIIFDSTPCMLVTDAVIISRMVDTTIIVSTHKKTKIENLKEVQKNIENVGGKIAGILINKIPVSAKKYRSKYYYYGDKDREKVMTETNTSKEATLEEVEIKQEEILEEVALPKENIENSNSDIVNQIDEYLNTKKEEK